MNDVKISGAGVIAGGEYNQVKIAGSGKIDGDITANELKISGAAKAQGSITSKYVGISGSMTLNGDLTSEECKIAGAMTIEGNLTGTMCKIAGSIKVNGETNVESLKLRSNGSTLTIIHGENIDIKGGTGWFKSLLKQNSIEEIEATNIDIDSVDAKRVAGSNIKIGKNCNIDLVEYSDSLTVEKSAKVGKTTKI